jgi:hypothetical protein
MKFSIRDLLLVTMIVALAVGWRVDRTTRIERMSKEVRMWKDRAEAARNVFEFSSGKALEWTETMPEGRPPYPHGPLIPVKD